MPVRIYDISKKLGLESKEILAKAKQLGIPAAKVPSSNLDKIMAASLEEEILKDHPDIAARPPPPQMPPLALIIGERVGFGSNCPLDQHILRNKSGQLHRLHRPRRQPCEFPKWRKGLDFPINQVQAIVKEFSLPFGSTPDPCTKTPHKIWHA